MSMAHVPRADTTLHTLALDRNRPLGLKHGRLMMMMMMMMTTTTTRVYWHVSSIHVDLNYRIKDKPATFSRFGWY
jgi:hypothetical protein